MKLPPMKVLRKRDRAICGRSRRRFLPNEGRTPKVDGLRDGEGVGEGGRGGGRGRRKRKGEEETAEAMADAFLLRTSVPVLRRLAKTKS